MKITRERLREIITEEVIKEELAPEIAVPAIAAMLQGTDSVDTSEIFGAVFDQMYGEGALEGEAERMAGAKEGEPEVRQPIGFGREPEEVSMNEPGQVGFRENINEIIQEEYYIYLIEEEINKTLVEMSPFDPSREFTAQGLSGDETLYYEPEEEGLSPERQLAVIRSQIGNMGYEIEKMLIALLKSGYSQEDIINMAIQLKRMDPHPKDVQVAEKKEKNSPWAICTSQLGLEGKKRKDYTSAQKTEYEKCVMGIKKEKGIE
jgi:hypothetical protein